MNSEELKNLLLYIIAKQLVEGLKEKEVMTPGLIREKVTGLLSNELIQAADKEHKAEIEELLIDEYYFEIRKNSIDVEQGLSLSDPDGHEPWKLPETWYY